MEILTIENLNKSFGGKQVLHGLDLSVPEHSIFGFIGRNGVGKTTTMKAILGLLRPDSGQIHVCGKRYVSDRPAQTGTLAIFPMCRNFMHT